MNRDWWAFGHIQTRRRAQSNIVEVPRDDCSQFGEAVCFSAKMSEEAIIAVGKACLAGSVVLEGQVEARHLPQERQGYCLLPSSSRCTKIKPQW